MSDRQPFQVGITGGIGSGKTFISTLFKQLGIPVYNSDQEAKKLINQNESIKTQIIRHFGEEAYQADQLNSTYVAALVFEQPEQLQKLNSWVHPEVEKDYRAWVKKHSKEPYVIKEAALLIESKSYKNLDYLLVISAPLELRKKRVLKRDPHRTLKEVEAIIARQLSDIERENFADAIINNNEKEMLLPQILRLHKFFLEKKKD